MNQNLLLLGYFLSFLYIIGGTPYSSAHFGAGSGPIVMDDVACTSSERRLIDCSFSVNHNCGHSEDAGVRCSVTIYGKPNLFYQYPIV